jgi:hypothetical protein
MVAMRARVRVAPEPDSPVAQRPQGTESVGHVWASLRTGFTERHEAAGVLSGVAKREVAGVVLAFGSTVQGRSTVQPAPSWLVPTGAYG